MTVQQVADDGLASRVASTLRGMRVVDLSPTLQCGIPNWPMHPPLEIDKAREVERGGYCCQLLMISEHTGTRVDSPVHFHPSMMHMSIDTFATDNLITPAVLHDFADKNLNPGELITLDMVNAYEQEKGVNIGKGEIALKNSAGCSAIGGPMRRASGSSRTRRVFKKMRSFTSRIVASAPSVATPSPAIWP